jgi:hypothetical protein
MFLNYSTYVPEIFEAEICIIFKRTGLVSKAHGITPLKIIFFIKLLFIKYTSYSTVEPW